MRNDLRNTNGTKYESAPIRVSQIKILYLKFDTAG